MSWSKSHAHSAKFRVNDCIILSKWFMSLQRHYIQSQWFRQHLFSITHPLLFPFYFSRLVLKLFIWEQGSCPFVFEMSDHQDTHWRCWQVTRPSPRSSTSPRGRGAPSPSWPGRWPGWPGGSRPWVLITYWDIGLGHITSRVHGPVKRVWPLVPPRTAHRGLRGTAAECHHQHTGDQGAWMMTSWWDPGSWRFTDVTWTRQ